MLFLINISKSANQELSINPESVCLSRSQMKILLLFMPKNSSIALRIQWIS